MLESLLVVLLVILGKFIRFLISCRDGGNRLYYLRIKRWFE